VLTAMGMSPERARGSLRFSLGKQNTPEDVDFALSLLKDSVGRLRELSPVYKRVPAWHGAAANCWNPPESQKKRADPTALPVLPSLLDRNHFVAWRTQVQERRAWQSILHVAALW